MNTNRFPPFFLILLTIFLFQCGTTDLDRSKQQYKQLQGDWVSNDFKPDIFHSSRSVFSFQDSLCSPLLPFFQLSTFKIYKDTIYVWQNDQHSIIKKNRCRKFKLVCLTSKKLQLIAIDQYTKDRIKNQVDGKGRSDTLTLHKIRSKNNIAPTKISFFASGCYGTCPSMYLEIDQFRNVAFYGRHHTLRKKGHSGRISKKEYAMILSHIHRLPLDQLKESYSANWTDDQTCCISIEHDGKTITCSAYGYDQEPIELRILFQRFIQLSDKLKLIPDHSIHEDSFIVEKTYYKSVRNQIMFLPPKQSN